MEVPSARKVGNEEVQTKVHRTTDMQHKIGPEVKWLATMAMAISILLCVWPIPSVDSVVNQIFWETLCLS